jgi:hypothetical protein
MLRDLLGDLIVSILPFHNLFIFIIIIIIIIIIIEQLVILKVNLLICINRSLYTFIPNKVCRYNNSYYNY